MKYKDYYQILGVPRDASPEDIKRAYRKLARKYHPDVSKEPNAEARFKEINEANAVLGDPERRRTFDALGTQWRPDQDFRPPPGSERAYRQTFHFEGGEDLGQFSDFFSSLFGGLGGRFNEGMRRKAHAQPQRERPAPPATRVAISLEEAVRGTTRQVRLEVPGEPQGRTLNVRIPAGVTQGQRIRLGGQGPTAGPGGAREDLYLEVEIQPHPLYQLEGRDLRLTLPITPWEAALGTTLDVPTLSGTLNLRIPEGSQSGRKLRLKGRGLPGEPPGDLYLLLEIRTPPAHTEQARQFYRRMAQELPFDPRATLG